jgi:aminoglycoside phosphotransferase (APT) family kinase protein
MSFANNLAVIRQLGKSVSLNCRDAVLPRQALPLSDKAVVNPAFLNKLFARYGIGDYRLMPEVSAARLLDIRSISSNCNNRVIALEYVGDSDREGPEATGVPATGVPATGVPATGVPATGMPATGMPATGMPATMFLKMPVTSLATRLFFNVIMSWELECEFYRKVAPRLPIRTPQAYVMASEGSRFLMLMENLHDDPGVVLHTNLEMMQGPDLDTVRRCLQTLASIHAEFHGVSRAERDQLLPVSLQPFTSPVMRAISPMMGKLAMRACRKFDYLELREEHIGWYDKALANWDNLVDWWAAGPLTLVHGDSHLGNHFLHGDDAGMLDWQAAQWGKGIRDVQYFLTDSLPADVLAANEKELVSYYIDAVVAKGVELDFAETWYQYRSFSLQTWMTIIVSMGFGAMTEDMDEVMPEIHRRCIASIERLELGKLLDEVIDNRSRGNQRADPACG